MGILNVTFATLIERLLPPTKRNPVILNYLKALSEPLQEFNTDLNTSQFKELNEIARYSSQVLIFEKLLNKIHNSGETVNLITIQNNGDNTNRLYVYREFENKPIYISNESENQPKYFYTEPEYRAKYDFTVNVPDTLTPKITQIKATINKNKLVGKTYNIVYYPA